MKLRRDDSLVGPASSANSVVQPETHAAKTTRSQIYPSLAEGQCVNLVTDSRPAFKGHLLGSLS